MPDEREDDRPSGAYVTLREVYDLILKVRDEGREVRQTVQQVILPELQLHGRGINRLNFKFYGLLAGFGAAITVVLLRGGVVP